MPRKKGIVMLKTWLAANLTLLRVCVCVLARACVRTGVRCAGVCVRTGVRSCVCVCIHICIYNMCLRACLFVCLSVWLCVRSCTHGPRNVHVKRKMRLSFAVCEAPDESGGLRESVQKLKGVPWKATRCLKPDKPCLTSASVVRRVNLGSCQCQSDLCTVPVQLWVCLYGNLAFVPCETCNLI